MPGERISAKFLIVFYQASGGAEISYGLSTTAEPDGTYVQLRRFVVECGVQVHDARLAAVAKLSSIPHILTLNNHDFERFTGITPIHPEELKSVTP